MTDNTTTQVTDADRVERTLSDHGRMLWPDDIAGICPSPDLCAEYAPVRCSPCAIKQAVAAGVEPLNQERSYLPEVCRLQQQVKTLTQERDALNEALSIIAYEEPERPWIIAHKAILLTTQSQGEG